MANSEKAGKTVYKSDVDGYLIDSEMYMKLFGAYPDGQSSIEETLNQFNKSENDYLIRQFTGFADTGSHTSLIINDMKIAGVTEGSGCMLYLDNDSFVKFVSDDMYVSKVMVKAGDSVLSNVKILKELDKAGIYPYMKFYADYQKYSSNLGMRQSPPHKMWAASSSGSKAVLLSFIP